MPNINNPGFQLPLFAGVDVGGTNIKIGLVDELGQTVAATKFPTQPDKSPILAFEQVKREFDKLLKESEFGWRDIAAVGLGTPGPMDIEAGMILTPSNLPGWHHFPVRRELEEIIEHPVTYANDAGAAAFGEFWIGGGKHHESIVLITLGTGVGGGIIINELSIDGSHSHGSEVGHIIIDTKDDARLCGCGQTGHLEAYASATALVNRTNEAMTANNGDHCDTILRQQMGEASPLSALMISQAAAAGDELSARMIDETAYYLARGIAILANVVDPAAFILGGAMNFGGAASPLGQKFISDVASATRNLSFPVVAQKLIVEFAELGSAAGYIGAAGLARQKHHQSLAAN